ncbi:PREDICTED: C-reactive protein-like [Priapulus caudatus]|uniref:C-reactive protein-like n=1 Tax=Priapulus caudatus TaxID=37621 RepID=A0ABM1ELC1_PRICU|nr:PREDICTED: C-reactive protein-like [Priapulus caudatus]
MTWTMIGGVTKVYIDGNYKQGATRQSGYHMPGGGWLVIGQEQDRGGYNFDLEWSWMGDVAGLNIFDRVLTPEEVKFMAKYCYHSGGNLFSWSETMVAFRREENVSCQFEVLKNPLNVARQRALISDILMADSNDRRAT